MRDLAALFIHIIANIDLLGPGGAALWLLSPFWSGAKCSS
jgi:hypothetical protein